jgi:nucleotide-binding universal stress UspA family protein
MNIAHILAATDLSQDSLGCIAPVADLARSVGARITLLHVLEVHAAIPHGAGLAPPLSEFAAPETADIARQRLEERAKAFGPGLDVRTALVVSGDTAEEITRYADANAVDLIAVATHGRTGFRHLVVGSVTEAVVRRSRVPVLVLPRPKR